MFWSEWCWSALRRVFVSRGFPVDVRVGTRRDARQTGSLHSAMRSRCSCRRATCPALHRSAPGDGSSERSFFGIVLLPAGKTFLLRGGTKFIRRAYYCCLFYISQCTRKVFIRSTSHLGCNACPRGVCAQQCFSCLCWRKLVRAGHTHG